jgi:hypothetical protein
MSDTDAGDRLAPRPPTKTAVRWKAIVELLGVVGADRGDCINGR